MKDDYDFKNEIEKQINESIAVKKEIADNYVDIINDISIEIIKAYKKNKKVIWFGNGGSAADSQHLACELVSKFYFKRDALRSIALTTNTSILTAVPNDYDFVYVFERQLEAFAEKGDILIGLSTSGTSKNVLKALEYGKKIGTVNVAFTGDYTKTIKKVVDYLIDVPSSDVPRIQESHIMIGHIICCLVEKELFKKSKK